MYRFNIKKFNCKRKCLWQNIYFNMNDITLSYLFIKLPSSSMTLRMHKFDNLSKFHHDLFSSIQVYQFLLEGI